MQQVHPNGETQNSVLTPFSPAHIGKNIERSLCSYSQMYLDKLYLTFKDPKRISKFLGTYCSLSFRGVLMPGNNNKLLKDQCSQLQNFRDYFRHQ